MNHTTRTASATRGSHEAPAVREPKAHVFFRLLQTYIEAHLLNGEYLMFGVVMMAPFSSFHVSVPFLLPMVPVAQ